jgi:hypothetical protein
MRALLVFESAFGNTQQIARSIAAGLRKEGIEVELLEVGAAPAAPSIRGAGVDAGIDAGIDLLVVGGPTHAWSMSRPQTRGDARGRALAHGQEPISHASSATGIREWLAALPAVTGGPVAAAFDTVIKTRWFPTGSAAKAAAAMLKRRGYVLTARPRHFYVLDTMGPLDDGELERAEAWGARLGLDLLGRGAQPPAPL